MSEHKRPRDEEEKQAKQNEEQAAHEDDHSDVAQAKRARTGAIIAPLPLSGAQTARQYALHSIFAFLTLQELASVSRTCRLWSDDAASLKGRGLQLTLDSSAMTRASLPSLASSRLRHHIVSMDLTCDPVDAGCLQLLQSLPALTGLRLFFLLQPGSMHVEARAFQLPLHLVSLNCRVSTEDGYIGWPNETLQPALIEAVANCGPSLQSLGLDFAVQRQHTFRRDDRPSLNRLNFSSLLKLAPTLTQLTLSTCAWSEEHFAVLRQMRALTSLILPECRFSVVQQLFGSAHELQQLTSLDAPGLTLSDSQLPCLAALPALTHMPILQLVFRSMEHELLLPRFPWLGQVNAIWMEFSTDVSDEQATLLFTHFSELTSLALARTPLHSLRWLRLMPQLQELSIFDCTQLHSSDIEHVFALTQLQSLHIKENERVLLTEETMAALEVPSLRLPRLTKFSQW